MRQTVFWVVVIAFDRHLEKHDGQLRFAREILEETDFQIGIDFSPAKSSGGKIINAVHRQAFQVAHQADRFVR